MSITLRDFEIARVAAILVTSAFFVSAGWPAALHADAAAGPAPTPALQSYFQAHAVVDEAVRASGGLQALQDLRTVCRELLDDWVDVGQGQRPWQGTPPADRLVAHEGFKDIEVLAFTDYAGKRYFQSEKYSDSPIEYAVEINAAGEDGGYQSIIYIDEKPFRRDYSAAELPALRAAQFRRYPEGLLRLALERPETLASLGRAQEDGSEQDVVSITDTTGAHVFLYFDAHTHLLAKSETLRAHPVAGDTRTETLYSDYRRVGALQLPFRYVDRVAGVPTHYLRARKIELDASLPEERFHPPQDGVLMEENPAEPRLQQMGDGLYLIRGVYNVMFAVFADYVLVVETPAGASYAEKCLELIRATAPGKPIHYAVASHFHFDHIAGVRTYVAEGIPILTTSDAKGVIEQSLASVRTMHPDELSRKAAVPVIEVASGPRVFSDASQRAEIYDFGPTPHVGQLLVTYFPRAKLLFVADLFDVLTTELVIAGVDGVAMAKKIDELGLDVERIIPVHGVPATMDDLRRGLAIRAKYVH